MSESPSESLNDAINRISGTMEEVKDIQAKFKGCLYGPSDAGKTVLAAGILKALLKPGQKILYIDTSEGTESLKNHGSLGDDVMAIPFTTIEDLEYVEAAIRWKQPPFHNIGGVVLDEGSSMAGIDTDRVFEARRARLGDANLLVPEWPDYNVSLQRFRSMLAKFFSVPGLNVIVTAHVVDVKGKNNVIKGIGPAFSPKSAAKVKEPMIMVAYLSAAYVPDLANPDNPPIYTRTVQVHSTGAIDAKSRIGGLPVRLSDYALVQAIKAWRDSGGIEVAEIKVEEPASAEEVAEALALAKLSPTESATAVEEVVEVIAESGIDSDFEIDTDFLPTN